MADNGSSIDSVIEILKKESPQRKFKESVELAVNLKDIDLSDPKNRLNEEIILPKGRGKEISVGVFGTEELKEKARKITKSVFGPEDISKFLENKKEFKKLVENTDYFIAESTLMASIGKSLGQILGPRGKIPKPIPPGQDPEPVINNLKKTVRARSRDKKTFHVPVGTREMSNQDLADNINAVIRRLITKLEKGYSNIDSIFVKTTMGKSYRIEVGESK
ncbi:MAG: 50S ribosomal protein L1 [Candidatus Thermoplasmatota archaeon]|nr:50S ribosomal protein L1 [Candidatus Thermoplasmatota archaeon]MCL5731315.1 50S ribosomal protein L1 [Candidatus Thermoplasmatota archaeon]